MAGDISGRLEYCVVLVTRPPIHSYGTVSDGFCTPPDLPQAIPWSEVDLASIPSMLPSLHFRRHFAICLVPKDIWTSRTITIFQKLDGQLFWDYYGNNTNYSRGAVWPSNTVRQINAIQDLGVALSGEDAANLCTEYYIELRRDWEYFNIWWNAADFALSLACLLVQDAPVQTCRQILQRLAQLRFDEVIQPRSRSCDTSALMGMATFVGGCALSALTAGAAAPVAMPAAIGGWTCAAGSVVTMSALDGGGSKRKRRREEAIVKLKNSFPRLFNLFGTVQL
ncbi:hypothetical protein GQ53DRAFT_833014 [Thozetella sp. PMI_491]|nr:hypothetical protein GQ53DRAFT_833014 [Thozetella sp. PMI_491]